LLVVVPGKIAGICRGKFAVENTWRSLYALVRVGRARNDCPEKCGEVIDCSGINKRQ
jgi:hypothetical protein